MVISVENHKFPFPRVFNVPDEGVPLGICYWCTESKRLQLVYPADKEAWQYL